MVHLKNYLQNGDQVSSCDVRCQLITTKPCSEKLQNTLWNTETLPVQKVKMLRDCFSTSMLAIHTCYKLYLLPRGLYSPFKILKHTVEEIKPAMIRETLEIYNDEEMCDLVVLRVFC